MGPGSRFVRMASCPRVDAGGTNRAFVIAYWLAQLSGDLPGDALTLRVRNLCPVDAISQADP